MESKWTAGGIYRRITEQIAAAIAAGAPRFEMPWHSTAGFLGLPSNAISGHVYRGINVVSLWVSAQIRGFGTDHWATYKQWQEAGARVRPGEKGSMIVFYKELKGEEEDVENRDPKDHRLVIRASWVFNADQVENWIEPPLPAADPVESLEQVEVFVAATGAEIHEGGNIACYHAHADYIAIPSRSQFVGTSTSSPTEAYYATLLHELTHWTGHPIRLNRSFSQRYGDEAYAVEELVAELGAAFLCAALGVTNVARPDHAAYVQSWLRVLGNDARAIFSAASKAVAAVDHLYKLAQPSPERARP